MIGEASRSTSFSASAEYVLNLKPEHRQLTKKEREKEFPAAAATSLDAPAWEAGRRHRIIGGNLSGETEGELTREFAAIRKVRPDIKNQLLCISIRKAQNDTVMPEQWRDVGAQVVENLGLQDCPYLIVQHRDKGIDKNDHIHILASLIRLDGKVVSDSQSYQKIERVMREVEAKYGFESVKSSRESVNSSPTWIEQHRFTEDGTLSSKMELQSRISRVLESKPTTTQFIRRLQIEHDVKVFPKLDADGFPNGIAFGFRDVALSGTIVGRGYAWKGLLKRGLTFDAQDLEAVKQASERAQIERRQKAGGELGSDDDLILAPGNVIATKTTDDEDAALRELVSQVAASEQKYAAARPVTADSQTVAISPSPEGDLAALLEPTAANGFHLDAESTTHDRPLEITRIEDLPPAPEANASASPRSESRTNQGLPEPKVPAADTLLPAEEMPRLEVPLSVVQPLVTRKWLNDSQSNSPATDATPETVDKPETDVSKPSPVITLPTLDRQEPKASVSTSEFSQSQHERISSDTQSTFTEQQVKQEEDPPVQRVVEASELIVPPARSAAGDDSSAQNEARQLTTSLDVSTTIDESHGGASAQADIQEPLTAHPRQDGIEETSRPPLKIASVGGDRRLPATTPSLTAAKKAVDESAMGDVQTENVTQLIDEPAQTRKQAEQLTVGDAHTEATPSPVLRENVKAVLEDTTRAEDKHIVKAEPTFAAKHEDISLNSLPTTVTLESQQTSQQPSPPPPITSTVPMGNTAAREESGGNGSDYQAQATKQSRFGVLRETLRSWRDPNVKQQQILGKYGVEREIASEGLKTYGSECTLRAQAMLDQAIINSARGQKHAPTSKYDLSCVLPVLHDVGELKEGKNWMDAGRRAAQEEGDNRVWKELGSEVGKNAREAARADGAELCQRAYATYEAKYNCAPHEAVNEIFERKLVEMEQQPPSGWSVELVNRLNEQRPVDEQLTMPVTELEALERKCRILNNGDDVALRLFEQIECKAVKEIPIKKLAELKPIQPAISEARSNHIANVMARHAHIVEGAREWYKETTGNDFTPEQRSVFICTIGERARVIKLDAEELRAVRLLSLKLDMPPPQPKSSLEARVLCAKLSGTDAREVWGQLAINIQKQQDVINVQAREREAENRRQKEQERQRDARLAARLVAALPNTPPTPERLAATTVKQIVELPPGREKEVAAKHAVTISFAEEQCRKAGEAPTAHSRKALITMLAVQDETKPTAQTLSACDYLHVAKEQPPPPLNNELEALTLVNDLKNTSEQFWLNTARAALAIGERMRQIGEMSVATVEVYRREKGREPSAKLQQSVQQNFINLGDLPLSDEHIQRITRLASDKGVPTPTFDNRASSSYWTMQQSPEREQKLLSIAERLEAKIAEPEARTFQINPADPQQSAGVLYTEWMLKAVQFAEREKMPNYGIADGQRLADEQYHAYHAYNAAAQQHESRYDAQPHPIMTGEQHDYLRAHKSSLDSEDRAAFGKAVVAGVSPANARLGTITESDHSPSQRQSLSNDFSP